MAKYLDPKADLTFWKIFGKHPDLVISLLNALLPLDEKGKITDIEYLPTDLPPEQPLFKNSIVDVRCKASDGRQFIVEMQMEWTTAFKQRVLFNASKAYVRQLKRAKRYQLLRPVYALSLVNAVFEPDMEEFYHYYKMVHEEHTEKVIDGLNLVFVELPKFRPQTVSEKKMMVLWLRFLTEIDENTKQVPAELLEDPDVSRAINMVEESAYTETEMAAYDKFWDAIRVEQAFVDEAEIRYEKGLEKGLEKGREKGREEGIEIGKEKGREQANMAIVRRMKERGFSVEEIADMTGLTPEEIECL